MIQILFEIIVLGVIAYFIETYLPMNDMFKFLFRVAIALIVLYLLLSLFGIVSPIPIRR